MMPELKEEVNTLDDECSLSQRPSILNNDWCRNWKLYTLLSSFLPSVDTYIKVTMLSEINNFNIRSQGSHHL